MSHRNSSHVNSEVTKRTIGEDTSNGDNGTVTEELSKLPTLAFSVTPTLQTILDGFTFDVVNNFVTVERHGTVAQVQFKKLEPNKNGVTPDHDDYNGKLPEGSSLKLQLLLQSDVALPEYLADDTLAISRLIPGEKPVSLDKQLAKIGAAIDAGKATTDQIAMLTAMLARATKAS